MLILGVVIMVSDHCVMMFGTAIQHGSRGEALDGNRQYQHAQQK